MLRRNKRPLIFLLCLIGVIMIMPADDLLAVESVNSSVFSGEGQVIDTARDVTGKDEDNAVDSAAAVGDTVGADSIVLDPILYRPSNEDSLLANIYVSPDSATAGRSPSTIMLRSVVFPGWGQFTNKKYIKAVIIFAAEVYLIQQSIYFSDKASEWREKWQEAPDELKSEYFDKYARNRDRRNSNLWYTGLTIFLSMFDAYVDAHLRNFPDNKSDQGKLSLDVEPGIEPRLCLHYNF